MRNKILIADDNQEIREVVTVLLSNEGYEMIEAADGEETVEKARGVDFIIMDVMMPNMDGFQACRRIREFSNVPILFLTAKSMDEDKELGFSSGGDDFLVKPFSYNELVTRVKALLRRYCIYKGKEHVGEESIIIKHNLKIDMEHQRVFVDEKRLNLTDIELRILLLLAQNPKRIYSNQELYEIIWEEPYLYTANNTIMVHIRNLRKKLAVGTQNSLYIRTVWGKGYRFD